MVPAKAYLEILTGSNQGKQIPVHFNPQSMQVTYQTQGPDGSQQLGKSGLTQGARSHKTGTITTIGMDLLFDTTDRNPPTDVRNITIQIVAMIQPLVTNGDTAPPPPLTRFAWGSFVFEGNVVQMSETIDFFSDQGVPLRSTVKLSMSKVERFRGNPGVLDGIGQGTGIGLSASAGVSASASAGVGFSAGASLSAGIAVGGTPLTLSQTGDSLQSLAGRAGVDASWKAIAAANNIDNPRNIPPGTPINLNVSASANAGASLNGGASANASANTSASF